MQGNHLAGKFLELSVNAPLNTGPKAQMGTDGPLGLVKMALKARASPPFPFGTKNGKHQHLWSLASQGWPHPAPFAGQQIPIIVFIVF